MNQSKYAVFRRDSRIWKIVAFFISLSCSSVGLAQNELSRVITLINGAEFEGRATSIPVYSEGLADSFPYGNKPIVMIDDGLRRVFFPFKRVAQIADSNRNELQVPVWQYTYNGGSEGYGLIAGISPFDENGHRILRVRSENRIQEFAQGLTSIGPRYCEVQSLVNRDGSSKNRRWTMSIGTSAIPIDILHKVLRKQIKDSQSPNEYLEVVDFLVQAQQYSMAIEELRFIQQKFPDLNDEIQKDRDTLRQIYARTKILNEVRARFNAGQTQLADTLATVFNKEKVAGEILAELFDIQNQIKQQRENVVLVRKQIEELVAKVKSAGQLDERQTEMVDRFRDELETELSVANISRFDTYLRLAADTSTSDLQKLALAISGWFTSSNSAIDNFAIVQSMMPVRDLVREYLTTSNSARRKDILKELAQYEAGEPEYLAKIIAWMTPTHASSSLNSYTGEKPIEFFVEVKGTKADPEPKRYRCLAHLPPQYDRYRQYPCILTLRPGIPLEKQLDRWAGSYNPRLGIRTGRAPRNGYIVVAVDWKDPGQMSYKYSLREHATVLKALKKSLQMFAIDTDRVFLSGHSMGATAAYDIGVSHPEHWAGIVGIGGLVDRYCFTYSKAVHVDLPVYSVVGQKDPVRGDNKKAWNQWLSTDKYLDLVLVEYRGRGNEPFHEEMPEIFKWAAAQRRKLPDKSGFELVFELLRPWDNYFWFWELYDVPEEAVHRPEYWSEKHPKDRVKMTVSLSQNQPNVFKKVGPSNRGSGGTIWLSPEFVDFSKRIEIRGRGRGFKDYVKPSRKVILDDVRRRADRKHPFWARVDCDGGTWSVPAGDTD